MNNTFKKAATALIVAIVSIGTVGCGADLNSELIATVKEGKGLIQDQRALLKKEVTEKDTLKEVSDQLVRQIFAQIGYNGEPEAVMMSFLSGNRGSDPGHLMTMVRHSGSLAKFLDATETETDTNVDIFTPSGKFSLKLVKVPAETSPPWTWSAVPRNWEKKTTEYLDIKIAAVPLSHPVRRGTSTQIVGVNISAFGGDLLLTKLKFRKSSVGATYLSRDVGMFKLLTDNGVVLSYDTINGEETGPTFEFPQYLMPSGASRNFYVECNILEGAIVDNIIALELPLDIRNIEVRNLQGTLLGHNQLLAGGIANNGVAINSASYVKVTVTE